MNRRGNAFTPAIVMLAVFFFGLAAYVNFSQPKPNRPYEKEVDAYVFLDKQYLDCWYKYPIANREVTLRSCRGSRQDVCPEDVDPKSTSLARRLSKVPAVVSVSLGYDQDPYRIQVTFSKGTDKEKAREDIEEITDQFFCENPHGVSLR